MSSLLELTTTTDWTALAVVSATGTVTHDSTPPTTYTLHGHISSSATAKVVVQVNRVIDIHLTCDAIYDFDVLNYTSWRQDRYGFVPLTPNPDVAGFGIILSFLITAFLVLLLAITAYVGGFLPGSYLRRADRLVLHVNSRNQDSRWREVIESITLSLSDQQLVTGLAILISGYYETLNNGLSVYHWNIMVYLAWMSSAVHIASLTLLKDVFQQAAEASQYSGSWNAVTSGVTHGCYVAVAQSLCAHRHSRKVHVEKPTLECPGGSPKRYHIVRPQLGRFRRDADRRIYLETGPTVQLIQRLGPPMARRKTSSGCGANDATSAFESSRQTAGSAGLLLADLLLQHLRGLHRDGGIVRCRHRVPLSGSSSGSHLNLVREELCTRRCESWRVGIDIWSACAAVPPCTARVDCFRAFR